MDSEELVDITNIEIDINLEPEERVAQFLEKVKNPNRFKVGDLVINITYEDTDLTFNECVQNLLKFL